MRLMMMIGALLLAAPAQASLAALLCSADRCLAASDSRTWDTVTDRPAGDTVSKLLVRAPYAVVVTHDPAPLSAWAQLSNRSHANVLPPSWTTLYELTKVPEPTLKHALQDGEFPGVI